MKSYFVAAALWLVPVLALPGDRAEIRIALPGPPTLAVIQPGVEVVVGLDDEVFHMKHQYWLRRDGDWYRARHHTDAFMYIWRVTAHLPRSSISRRGSTVTITLSTATTTAMAPGVTITRAVTGAVAAEAWCERGQA